MINGKIHTCGCGPELGREQTIAGEACSSQRARNCWGKILKETCLNVSSSFARGK